MWYPVFPAVCFPKKKSHGIPDAKVLLEAGIRREDAGRHAGDVHNVVHQPPWELVKAFVYVVSPTRKGDAFDATLL